jgi:hypothetical protein
MIIACLNPVEGGISKIGITVSSFNEGVRTQGIQVLFDVLTGLTEKLVVGIAQGT